MGFFILLSALSYILASIFVALVVLVLAIVLVVIALVAAVLVAVVLVAVVLDIALFVTDRRAMNCLGADCTHNESDDGEHLHIRSSFHCLGSRCQSLKGALTPSQP